MRQRNVWVRIAGIITMTMLLLAGWSAFVLSGWLPDGIGQTAACLVAGFNILSVLALLLAQRSGHHVPGGIFLVQVMTAVFVWELLFDLIGTLLGTMLWIGNLLLDWNVAFSSGGYLLLCFTAVLGIYSVFVEPHLLDRNRFRIAVPGLAKVLSGFTIAQISDIHLGAMVPISMLKRLLDEAAGQSPDVLVITGDLFDSPHNEVNDEAARLLDRYAARFPEGIYYVWGNHEYYRDTEAISRSLKAVRVHELRNSSRMVKAGAPPLYFAGVDYPVTQGVMNLGHTDFVEQACQNVPSEAVLIMLAHHPDFFEEARKAGAILTLSGHTHGTQLGLFGHTLLPFFKYNRGLYEQDGCYCYVHKGDGGRFPFRLGCMPEIAYFTLESSDNGN